MGIVRLKIARRLGVSAKTIGREIAMGTMERLDTNLREYKVYSAEYAQLIHSEHVGRRGRKSVFVKDSDLVRHT